MKKETFALYGLALWAVGMSALLPVGATAQGRGKKPAAEATGLLRPKTTAAIVMPENGPASDFTMLHGLSEIVAYRLLASGRFVLLDYKAHPAPGMEEGGMPNEKPPMLGMEKGEEAKGRPDMVPGKADGRVRAAKGQDIETGSAHKELPMPKYLVKYTVVELIPESSQEGSIRIGRVAGQNIQLGAGHEKMRARVVLALIDAKTRQMVAVQRGDGSTQGNTQSLSANSELFDNSFFGPQSGLSGIPGVTQSPGSFPQDVIGNQPLPPGASIPGAAVPAGASTIPVTGTVSQPGFGGFSSGQNSSSLFRFMLSRYPSAASAFQQAVDRALEPLLADLDRQPWEALIAEVDQGRVFVGAGRREGVKPGDHFTVTQAERVITDPETGEALETISANVGHIEVVKVYDRVSEARILDGSDFKRGFAVHPDR